MRDTFGLVPSHIRANIERRELLAHDAEAGTWTRRIRDYDPQASCVWAREDIHPGLAEFHGIVPGRYHIKRENPGTEDTYIPVTTPDGGYRDMSDAVLEEWRSRDLRRTGALQRVKDRDYRERKSREKQQALSEEQRKDEIKANYKTAKRVAGEGGMKRRKWGVA